MNDKGSHIVKSLQSIRDFHADVAKLLQAATSIVAEGGWVIPGRASACGSGGSKAIYSARYWMPEDAFQFYRNESNTTLLAYVSVVFDDVKNPENVPEPFASAGWLQFASGGPGSQGEYQYPWCRLAMTASSELHLDGQWREVDAKAIDPKGYYPVERARTMACPLLSIGNEEELKTLIVEPLLDDLPKNESAT